GIADHIPRRLGDRGKPILPPLCRLVLRPHPRRSGKRRDRLCGRWDVRAHVRHFGNLRSLWKRRQFRRNERSQSLFYSGERVGILVTLTEKILSLLIQEAVHL